MRRFAARWGDLMLAGAMAALVLIQGITQLDSAPARLGTVALALAVFVVLGVRCRFPLVPLVGSRPRRRWPISGCRTPATTRRSGSSPSSAIYTAAAHTEGVATVVAGPSSRWSSRSP